jgi:sugar phosphate isomerase/epimerase
MTEQRGMKTDRRAFMKDVAVIGGAVVAAGSVLNFSAVSAAAAQSASTPDWSKQIGLELYTVRDTMTDQATYISTLEKVAAIGYKEVEPVGYAGLEPKDFRALLDRLGLTAPSTHAGASEGPDLEKQLEGFQTMGIKYCEISAPRGPGRSPAASGPGRAMEPGSYYNAGDGLVYNSFKQTTSFGPYQPPVSLESVQQRAVQLNEHGKIAKKFGIKMLIHNHTGEFEKLTDSPKTTYEVLLAETDPDLVTMQLDIGWALIAGVNVFDLFRDHPGRFELWHVKDMVGLKTMNQSLSPNQRTSSTGFTPVGAGQVDYKTIFSGAQQAGMKHFCVEQDNAASWGDSMATARVSYNALSKMLTA